MRLNTYGDYDAPFHWEELQLDQGKAPSNTKRPQQ